MRKFKLISDWMEIEYKTPENVNDEYNFVPYFVFNGEEYLLSDFTRLNNNPWLISYDIPKFIHGVDATNYHNPYFLEVDDCGDNVRLYKEIKN